LLLGTDWNKIIFPKDNEFFYLQKNFKKFHQRLRSQELVRTFIWFKGNNETLRIIFILIPCERYRRSKKHGSYTKCLGNLNNAKFAIFTTTMVMSQRVAAMSHTGHNSVKMIPFLQLEFLNLQPCVGDYSVIARMTCWFCCVFNSTRDFLRSTLKLENYFF